MERYTQLNADYQRTAKRDRKTLSEQCKEIEENNRMGRMRLLFKKIGDMKGIFHARMGTIKDRNGKDLTEAEEIKKRWQEYTELYKKVLMTQTSWSVKTSRPQEAFLQTNLEEVMEFRLSYFKF